MKYDQRYPNLTDLDEADGIMYSKYKGKCFVCGCETHYIDICYEDYLCSEECDMRAAKDAAEATTVRTNLRQSIAEFCDWRARNELCSDGQCSGCPVNDTYDMAREPDEDDIEDDE